MYVHVRILYVNVVLEQSNVCIEAKNQGEIAKIFRESDQFVEELEGLVDLIVINTSHCKVQYIHNLLKGETEE